MCRKLCHLFWGIWRILRSKIFWSYQGRKVSHLALAELPIYRDCPHGHAWVGFIYTFWCSLLSTSSILVIICKWLFQKDFNIFSSSFQNLFVVVFTWKRMQLSHLTLLLKLNEVIFYQFKCHLSYRFRHRFSCFLS